MTEVEQTMVGIQDILSTRHWPPPSDAASPLFTYWQPMKTAPVFPRVFRWISKKKKKKKQRSMLTLKNLLPFFSLGNYPGHELAQRRTHLEHK